MTDTSRPLVTVAIPTYNRADAFLREALESALNQTYKNIEIIVSDNCSIDNTEELVGSYPDHRIRYIKQPQNIGANNNFNHCLEQARGAYFLLLSDDDLIDPDMVEVCMDTVKDDTSIGILRTGTRLIDGKGEILWEYCNPVQKLSTSDFFRAWFANKTTFYLCSTLFNTARLKEIGGFHSRHNLFQDVVAEVRLAAKYGRADIYDVKASFRRHGPSVGSAAKISNWCEDCLYLLDVMCDQVPDCREDIWDKGLVYFCKKNYMYTARLGNPVRNFGTYLMIYNKFNRVYSPMRYIRQYVFRPWVHQQKSKIKAIFSMAGA